MDDYNGKSLPEPQETLMRNCTKISDTIFFRYHEASEEVEIHYGLIGGTLLLSFLIFVVFHISYRQCKYRSYMKSLSQQPEMNQPETEIEGPEYYESVELYRNYHTDAENSSRNTVVDDNDYYAVP